MVFYEHYAIAIFNLRIASQLNENKISFLQEILQQTKVISENQVKLVISCKKKNSELSIFTEQNKQWYDYIAIFNRQNKHIRRIAWALTFDFHTHTQGSFGNSIFFWKSHVQKNAFKMGLTFFTKFKHNIPWNPVNAPPVYKPPEYTPPNK